MKGTEKIIAHIEADAKAREKEILEDAERQCAEIRASYEEKASELYAERIREGVRACQDEEDGVLRIANMEARKNLLAMKQEMVSRSFRKAEEKLVSLPAGEYIEFLSRLVKQAAPDGEGTLILNEKDRGSIGQQLLQAVNADGARLTLAEETRDMAGGFVLRSGAVETNCSVELLLDLCRNELTHQLAELLFR